MAPDGFVLIAQNDEIVQLDPEGNETTRWSSLAGPTDIQGMTFVGNTLYIGADNDDKIYKATVPSGIQITTDPRALAYGTANSTTTLFVLVDGVPADKILLVDPADGSLASSYDAPDDSGEGLSYLGGSLYYASSKDNNRKIYRLNPDTGAQMSSFNPQNQWGDINENLLGLGNDGNDLLVSTNNPWDTCLQQVDSGAGTNQGQLCADGQQGIVQAKGVAVAPDGFILVAKNDEIVQLTPEGQENARWAGLLNATDIQGLTYVSTTLYVADADTDKVYKTTVPSGIQVSTDPLGLAYGTANSTTTLFVLVGGTPKDKVLLVDPLDGSLRSSYDAPDDDGGGLTYLGTSLYYASNGDGNPRIIELAPDTGAQLGSFLPQNQWGDTIWNNLLTLTNNGNDILISTLDPWDQCLKWLNSSNGGTEGQFCPPWEQGLTSATGLAVTADGDVLEAKDGTIVHVTADETFAITYQTGLGEIIGLTFVSASLYMADDATDTIYKATVPSGVEITTDPRALAYGTVGTSTTMFILVDATPKDKVLLVDLATDTLVGSFDAPDRAGQGLTYLGASLYYAGREQDGRAKVYELNPNTGAELSNVSPRWDWGGEIFDQPHSMGNDGSDLLMTFGPDDCIQRIDPSTGDNRGRSCPQQFGQSARGIDMASDGSFFTARDSDVVQLVSINPDLIEVGRWSRTSTTDIEGLVFVGEVVYLADDGTDSVYKASKPSGITNDPQGLAYDGTSLYILVDAALADHILVVNPTSSAVVADFEAPDRNANGITFLQTQSGPTLFVSVTNEGPWGRQHFVHRISPNDGSELAPPVQVFFDEWVDGWYGLTNDGESLILAPSQEGFVILLDPETGNFETRIGFYGSPFSGFGAMAYQQSQKDFLATTGNEVLQIDEDGRFLQSFMTSLGKVSGAVVIGDALYLADRQSSSILAAAIPSAPFTVSTSPKGMATDGANLYLVVDGSPKDRILVLAAETGQVMNSYEAPGDNVDGLAWHNGDLYVVTNEFHPFEGQLPPHIHKLGVCPRIRSWRRKPPRNNLLTVIWTLSWSN